MSPDRQVKDEIARRVQLAVQHALNGIACNLGDIHIDNTEVRSTDKLNTQVRVKTISHGIHYINVKVSGS